MLDRLISVAVAVSLAFLVWLHSRTREQETLDNIPIPVQIQLSAQDTERYLLELNGPSQVVASFTGPAARIRELRGQLQRGEIHVASHYAVSADRANEARYLDTIGVKPEEIQVPPGVHVTVLAGQNRIPVTIRRMIERPLPVTLDHALDDRLGTLQIEPPTVVVRGPQEVVERLASIPTRPFLLPRNTPTDSLEDVPLRSGMDLRDEIDGQTIHTFPDRVMVRATLRPKRKTYEVRIPVQFLCPANCPWQPQWASQTKIIENDPSQTRTEPTGMITVKLIGPAQDEAPPVRAFVDLTGREFQILGDLRPRLYTDEPIQLQLPKEFQVTHCPSRVEAFHLYPRYPRAERLEFLSPGLAAPLPLLPSDVAEPTEGQKLLMPAASGLFPKMVEGSRREGKASP
ncbi:YbbR-like domain-containing protein [Tuwongella immobilis]|uniref:Uncharacterized protein n=1 Tax=Tuwongella immobilis TaxID=692036 RepID=A0A6C2YR09_9BACT|nr:hypothetical protein [Tuwongella immobilis]VIP03916.1 Putative uncharacterized protein OS=uncultured planctomycete GN=HGMM_F11F07C21 PE=4 SV=1 [Tuwongella immobilis]VTS05199.1 Putative uncharacterized protein OS=uncultured planctomycete GN=HGMM_F11F07C21 PE=4 SV=1 [Tuwongella immobilis]